MENMQTEVINQVVMAMQEFVDTEILRSLKNIMESVMCHYTVTKECTELSTNTDDNDYIIQTYIANKKLENRRPKTLEQYSYVLGTFFDTVNKNYKDITKEDIKRYLYIYGRGKKQNTICNMKKYLSAFFGWLADEEYIPRNPVRAIKGICPEEIENLALSVEEELALRDAADSAGIKNRAVIDLLLSTGLRVSEIESLNRNDVDFMEGSITFRGAKSYKYRTVYLDARAKKHLFEYLQSRTDTCEALFVGGKSLRTENGMVAKRMHKAAYESVTKGIGSKAGIRKHVTVHVLRKTFATRLADRGCPLEIIQQLLGHADPGTTSRHYVQKSKKRTQKACEQYLIAA